eukprot:TRINITY_DN62568_c0_g1_i1.p1 TRINITY_DN62568_c0_g1~~TRINITY_DN62568_c0_g1_i1.p1  ORF type:complete len:256 (-),score=36.14 TRINITY_DN62568_c0_g1_i1:42-779(-)
MAPLHLSAVGLADPSVPRRKFASRSFSFEERQRCCLRHDLGTSRRSAVAWAAAGACVVELLTCPRRCSAKALRSSKTLERRKLDDGSELVKLASGVQYLDIRIGRGNIPELGELVLAHVKGYLMDKNDTVFLDTYKEGGPLMFTLGTQIPGVTDGLEEALATMPTGTIRAVQVPSYLGYPEGLARAAVRPPILQPMPVGMGLRYEVELLRCVDLPKEAEVASSQRICCADPAYPCNFSDGKGPQD